MGSWAQWNASKDELRRAWLVFGRDHVVAEQVVAYVRQQVGGSLTVILADEVDEVDVWAEVNSFVPPGADRRLVVVRGAETISDWRPFEAWLAARNQRGTHALFVADTEFVDTKQVGFRRMVHTPAVRLVRCSLSSEERKEGGCEGADWVATLAPMDYPHARRLWEVVGRDASRAWQVVEKARLLGSQVDDVVIRLLVEPEGPDDFCLELVGLRKDRALEALSALSEGEYGLAIGRLEYRLTQLRRLNRAMRSTAKISDAIKLVGMNNVPDVGALASVSPHYDHVRAARCTYALAVADRALQTGETEGVMEALVCLW